jgi:hypothetical protein
MLWRASTDAAEAFTIYIVFTILTAVAGLAALGFLLLYQSGWLLAMMVQGLCLFVALINYFVNTSPIAAQITMLYSIVMVLYLNSFMVRTAFQTGTDSPNSPGEGL